MLCHSLSSQLSRREGLPHLCQPQAAGTGKLHPKIRGATALQELWAGLAVALRVSSLLRAVSGCLQPVSPTAPQERLTLPVLQAWELQAAQGTLLKLEQISRSLPAPLLRLCVPGKAFADSSPAVSMSSALQQLPQAGCPVQAPWVSKSGQSRTKPWHQIPAAAPLGSASPTKGPVPGQSILRQPWV